MSANREEIVSHTRFYTENAFPNVREFLLRFRFRRYVFFLNGFSLRLRQRFFINLSVRRQRKLIHLDEVRGNHVFRK